MVALCVPWATRAQETLTVADGTSTTSYVPVYGYWADAYNRSQSVYPASMLSELPAGATISQLQYYSNTANKSWGSASFVVKIGETSQTSLTTFDNSTSMTTVYTGSLSVVSNVMVIELDDPYVYNGGNLLIEVNEVVKGSYSSCSFYCVSQTNGSRYAYNSSSFASISSTGNVSNYLPKVTFTYTAGVITCPRPTDLTASSITSTSALVTWLAGGEETAWDLQYKEAGSDYGTPIALTSTSYSLSGLTPNTEYTVAVRANCGGTDGESTWKEYTFRTECAGISSFPYTNDFESDPHYTGTPYADAFPSCWTRINDATGSTNYYPYLYASSSYAHSGSTGMYWYHSTSSTYANNEYAVLPGVDLSVMDIADLTLMFYARTTNASYHPQPIIGVMTDRTDASTFTPIHTFSATDITTTWQQFAIPLASYTGTGNFVAIKWPRTSSTCYMAIDDIFLGVITCFPPSDVTVSASTPTTTTLTWTPNGNESEWTLRYAVAGSDDYDTIENITASNITLSSLIPNTTYTYSIQANCGTDGMSLWSNNANFTTARCAVSNLTTLAVTAGAAQIAWTPSAFSTATQVEYKLHDDVDWTVAGTTEDSVYLLTGLNVSSNYDVRVRSLCEGVYSFETMSFSTADYGCLVGSQSTVTIGEGTATYQYLPTYNLYNYSLTQQIFTAAELNASGNINGISFMPATVNTASRDIEIYVGHIASATATQFQYPADLTLVYSGSPTFVANEWCNITFTNAFAYNGTDNLLVIFRDLTGSWTSSNYYYSHTAPAGSGASRYVYQDDSPYSIGFTGGTASDKRMNAIFDIGECYTPATCAAPAITVDELGAHSVQISWIPGSTETSWKVYYKESSDADYTYAATVTERAYTFTGLDAETDYNLRVVSLHGTDSNFAVVSATTMPSCMPVTALTATNITTTGATITWTAGSANADWLNNNEVNYTLKYNVQGSSNITTVPVNGTSYVIANGGPATTYEISVQANCGSDDGLSTIAYTTFTTEPLTAALPYSCNFNSLGSYQYYWMFMQEGMTNHWMVGPDAHAGTSGSALYITNDGEHNAYTNNAASYAYAFVQLNLADSGEYEYSFDWSGYGEGSWDFMRVALVPTSTTLTYSESGTSFGSDSYSASAVPTGAIVLDGPDGKLNQSDGWTSLDGVVNLTGAQRGMYRLVVYWRNDGSVGTNPPAAIDNIVFKRLTCHKPTALATVYDTNNASVNLTWTNNETGATTWEVEYGPAGFFHGEGTTVTATGTPAATLTGLQPNQIYDFYVRTVCSTNDMSAWSTPAHVTTVCGTITALPYTATFEGNPTTGFATCWTYNGNHESLSTITSTTSYVHRGTRAMRIRQHDTITENQYAAMNAVAANLPMNGNQVTFYSRCNSGNTTVTVGVMSDPEDASTFSAIKTLNLTTAYTAYNVMLDAYNGTGRHLAFMVAPAAANYIYIDDVTLDYMPECPTPDGMLAVSTDDGIRLNWDGHKSTIDQWQIRYTWKHIDSTEAYRQVDTLIVNANERRADGSYIFENPELVTNYTFAVRNVCDAVNNEYSEWSTVADLTTDICSNMFIDTIGTTDTVSRILPVTANYNNSYTQQIVLASEIETKASISALRLLFAYTENYRYKNNVTIYMGLTEKTEFTSNTDFIPLSTMTQVYSGALNITADSWNQSLHMKY